MTVGFSQGKQQNFQLETVSMGQWNDYSLFDDDDFDEVKGDYDDFFFFPVCMLHCPSKERSHEKSGVLYQRKASCSRIALPSILLLNS